MVRQITVGDNLNALAGLKTGSAQLVYMDPPFASGRVFDAILSDERSGGAERVSAFDDTWRTQVAGTSGAGLKDESLVAFVRQIGRADMANYLAMMLPRLREAHRVLEPRGSIYLHCDPSASHYLKLALDVIFGADNFRNEIIWKRTHAHSGSRRFGPVHDVILFYSRSADYIWNPSFRAYDPSYLEKHFRLFDERGAYQLITCTAPGDRTGTRAHYEWKGLLPPPGRHWAWKIERMHELDAQGLLVHSANGVPRLKRYVDDGRGVALQDVWLDINRLDAHSDERVGYDTQKPVELVRRIVEASTEPGGLVVDPFCGSGTTAVAAEQLGRSWAIADLSLLAGSYALARSRQVAGNARIRLSGFPESTSSAERLFKEDPQTFGVWGIGMLATITDRKSSNAGVFSGSGSLKIGRRPLALSSWVPVSNSASLGEIRPSQRKRLPDVGLVLRAGRSAADLEAKIRASMPSLPISAVPLASLVDSQSTATGLVSGASQWDARAQ